MLYPATYDPAASQLHRSRANAVTGALPNWLKARWDTVRASLWFVPGLMFGFGVLLAFATLEIDQRGTLGAGRSHWLIHSGDGEDARSLVATLLTAVITMASMAFSVTVVALSLAANAYGPRLIRLFRADLRTQLVLGTFLLTIVYMLMVLRFVQGASGPAEVPHISVTLASALALLGVFALLAFIQGLAKSIVADEVVRRVRKDLDAAVERLPLIESGQTETPDLPEDFEQRAARIRLPREGYVQAIDYEEILSWAVEHQRILRLDFRAGDFVVDGDRRLLIYPPPEDDERARKQIGSFVVSGQDRTPTQDLKFAVRHLVEVALRALSPGINDPFTAIAVIDRLRGGLCRLAGRATPSEAMNGPDGKLRVVRRVTAFAGAVDAAFNQIRQSASSKPAVLIHMLEALGATAEHTRTDEQRAELLRHAKLINAAAGRDVDDPADRADVEKAFRWAAAALNTSDGTSAA